MVAYKNLKRKEKARWQFSKAFAVAYGSGRLRELFIRELKWQVKLGFTMLVALYESGRKESFDCTCDIFKLLHMRDIFIFGGHRFSSTKSVA